MSPVTHFLSGWVFANCAKLGRRDRAIVTLACVAPDIDGLGIIPELLTRNSAQPLLWFSNYHHSLHNLMFGVVVAVAGLLLVKQRWKVAFLSFVSFHIHLLEDLIGSRGPDGYQWPIAYLKPFSNIEVAWRHQWALNAWQNVAITVVLLLVTLCLAWKRGYSPLEMISRHADCAFVQTLRERFPSATSGAKARM
jgi:hypothetical protein